MSQGVRFSCQCDALAHLASDPNCPVEFDEALNEYNILSREGNAAFRIYYCFVCGGVLPESKRADLYTNPSKQETEQIKRVLAPIRTMAEVVSELGEPDEVTDPPRTERDRLGQAYRRFYHYTKRWKSLELIVREQSDSSVEFAIVGKYVGSPPGSTERVSA